MLVLDDATSAVDARTEQSIHDALRDVLADRTTLLVAHRLSTLDLADRIVVMDAGRVAEQGTHDELAERSPLYRSLLAGLDDDEDGEIHDAQAAIDAVAAGPAVTAAAWSVSAPGGARVVAADARRSARPASGPGSAAAPRAAGRSLAATPELLAQVAALPPVRDVATVDVQRETREDGGFTLLGVLRAFRRPLLIGLVLVILDALAGIAGPILVKTGVDSGVTRGSTAALFAASGALLVVTLADLITEIGETFVTGRAAERIMLSLRIRVWAQLQRLSLDYYEREMAGRIMTRMTTDVDQFESLIENGLLSALVSLVTFVGVGIALLLINFELGLCTLTVVVPLAGATVLFRRRATRLYDEARERIAVVNADFQESLSGVREAQAFAHEPATIAHFHELGRRYLRSRVAAQRLVAVYFPFVQLISAVADAIVLGVGAHLVASGDLTTGALIAFILYIDLFFSPIQQLSQVFDSWQQTRVSVERITELMALQTLTPAAADPIVPERLAGQITLQGVRFSYPVAQPPPHDQARGPADPRLSNAAELLPVKPPEALRGVDLELAAGETVALVGETGAGKSTLIKLLARFYDPDAGPGLHRRTGPAIARPARVSHPARLRAAGGVPVQRHDPGQHRLRPAARPPTPRSRPPPARWVPTTSSPPSAGGYRAQITERGGSISSGQRQLLALARAELVDPAVLLLDEATSNLDLATEALVTAAMQRRRPRAHHGDHRPSAPDGSDGRPDRGAEPRDDRRDRHARGVARRRRRVCGDVEGVRGDGRRRPGTVTLRG